MLKPYPILEEEIEWYKSSSVVHNLSPVLSKELSRKGKLYLIWRARGAGFVPGARVIRQYDAHLQDSKFHGIITRFLLDKPKLGVKYYPFEVEFGTDHKSVYGYEPSELVLVT